MQPEICTYITCKKHQARKSHQIVQKQHQDYSLYACDVSMDANIRDITSFMIISIFMEAVHFIWYVYYKYADVHIHFTFTFL